MNTKLLKYVEEMERIRATMRVASLRLEACSDIIRDYNLTKEDAELLARVADFQKNILEINNYQEDIEDIDFEGISLEGDDLLSFKRYEYPDGIVRIYDSSFNTIYHYGVLDRQFLDLFNSKYGKEIGRRLTEKPIKIEYYG